MKILEVFAEPLSYGGQEAFILNMYTNFKNEDDGYIFFTPYYCDNKKLKEVVSKKKDVIVSKNKKFNSIFRKIFYIRELKSFLKNNNSFDVVHIHSGSIFALAKGAQIANKYNMKRIIVHSHCTGIENIKHKMIKAIFKRKMLKYPTDYFACSVDAAKFKFPESIINNNKYTIINNGIDLKKFNFNEEDRKKYRKEIGIEDNRVLINIGRMTEQKNQLFLIDVLNILINEYNCKNTKLIIVGDGPLKQAIVDKIKKYELEDYVIILSNRNDIPQLLSASDMFVFPSIYEGLGIVVIEAQASGLPTICSEMIPEEANITPLFNCLELSLGAKEWATNIKNYMQTDNNRKDYSNLIKEKKYDVQSSAEYLEKKYYNR